MPINSFIQNIGMLYNYFLEYMMFIELNYHNVNNNQSELLLKNLNNECDPINDKSSCLWAISRCFTFSSITKKIFNVKEIQEIKKIDDILHENNKPKKNINFIHITIIPDHVFNLFKFDGEWYYISSWMLLYSGVIIKISNIEDFMLSIKKYFESSEFLINRKNNHEQFINFIEKYFIFKLFNASGTIVKINNFNLINNLIYRTGENMIEQMLNLNKIKKNSVLDRKHKYELKIFVDTIDLDNNNELAFDKIIENFYNEYVNNKNIFVDENNEFADEQKFLKNNKNEFKKIITSFIGVNKYQSKLIRLTLNAYKYKKQIDDKKKGGSFSYEMYQNGLLHFNNNNILNHIFMGNMIKLYNPGFRTSNDNSCNIIFVLKYYNILKYFGYSNIFENLCENLFDHYSEQKTYIIKKKYYLVIKNNRDKVAKVCVINIYDNKYLYGFMIIESNNRIQIILLESDNGKEIGQQKILSQISNIITFEKIVLIDDHLSTLSLLLYDINHNDKINYCKIIDRCKRHYLEIIHKNNIESVKDLYLFLCESVVNGNIEPLKFKSSDLLYELTNGIIFDILDLINQEDQNTDNFTKTSYMIDLGELLVNNSKYLFYKKLYNSLNITKKAENITTK